MEAIAPVHQKQLLTYLRLTDLKLGLLVNFNSAKIKSTFYSPLSKIADILNRYPRTQIVIAGHTDSVGSAASNESLSERRAKSVRDYLISAGVNPDNLTAKGYGEMRPTADNTSALGRAVNRRVELIILNR